MMAALRTDTVRRDEIAVEDHLAAARALAPERVRRGRAAHQALDPRTDEVRDPIHDPDSSTLRSDSVEVLSVPPYGLRAAWTAFPRLRQKLSASSINRVLGSAERTASAIRDTIAEPTTAASAMRAIDAAPSGVRMPNPTAQGRSVARLMRSSAIFTSCSVNVFVPVTPATET